MNTASKNQGVRIIASFEDGAVALNTPATPSRTAGPSRSANEGIRLFADFESDSEALNGSEARTLEPLSLLLAQHEHKVQRLVNELQGKIEELQKQNADLRHILLERDRLLGRYYLDGPGEDDI